MNNQIRVRERERESVGADVSTLFAQTQPRKQASQLHYSGFRVDGTGTQRCPSDRGPYRPPFGDCAIYSEPKKATSSPCP